MYIIYSDNTHDIIYHMENIFLTDKFTGICILNFSHISKCSENQTHSRICKQILKYFRSFLNMIDVALKSAGAQVVLATSSDDRFPPENIIDGYIYIHSLHF